MASPACLLCLAISAFIFSCLFIAAGIVGITIGPRILQSQVNQNLPLTVDSAQLDSWKVPPVPVYLQFWLWECVNVNDVLTGTKPMLRERGPFTYLEHRQKQGVYFNPNSTITYRQTISYTFIRNMSAFDEGVVIKMINIPLVTVVTLVRNQSNVIKDLVNAVTVALNESLFAQHTAREWIWGYDDPFLLAIQKIPIFGQLVPDPRFGFFSGQNTTDDGLYTIYTGKQDINLLNSINKWNGVSTLPFWNTTWSNMINGTDGSWFSPLFEKDLSSLRLYLYSTQICRSLYAKFDQHSSTLDIPTETFTIPAEVFLNATLNPDNIGFGNEDSGVLDVSVCNKGAPIFISLPHLLYAADRYRDGVDGIAPNPNEHRTTLAVEPHTGLVLSAQKRLQINVHVTPDPIFRDFHNITNVVLPAMWINESTTIDEKSAHDLNNQVLRLFTIVRWVSIVLIVLGGVLLVLVIVLRQKRRLYKKENILFNGSVHNSIAAQND